ncbi:MAG TPA: hypothetical protein VER57_02180 [Cyanobium sp.]|nr:hypothetical protein [Cyanobium sp.]
MQLQASLVHAEGQRRVVLVTAREGERVLGSALGEAAGAEEAEDRALARLLARLEVTPEPLEPSRPSRPVPEAALPEPLPEPSLEPLVDPDDWSAELAQLDLQLLRLGWSRDQEAIYLQRAFGHPSRNRLTTYADLTAYLRVIQSFTPDSDPATAAVPLRRGDLLSQCDQLLEGLGWGAEQGRTFLQQQLGAASRQQLSDQQLLQFNMLLEEQMIRGSDL